MTLATALSALLGRPSFRFSVASALALALDFAATMALRAVAPLSLAGAAAIAFALTAPLFYFFHEYWTFARTTSKASVGRLVQNLVTLGLALTGRVGIIGVLERIAAAEGLRAFLYFACGVATSFTINFLLNKFWVFRR
jgi:putative flippase GtrA